MVEAKHISKSFGQIKALCDVNFQIQNNSIVGLLGPNGAGKTTLMRIIVGFLTATRGKLLWDGKIVRTKSNRHKLRIGYLPENNPLYLSLTPIEYLEMTALLKQIEKEAIDREVVSSMKRCGLLKVATQKIETLSKGYRQRVGLAAALLGSPEILILDEPTSGLDPNQIIEIRDLIKRLSKEKMILLSTHILPEAREICDKILIINRGKIVLDEKTEKIENLEKKFVNLTS